VTQTLDHLLTHPATLILRTLTGEDADGDPVYSTTETETVCELQMISSSEEHEGGVEVTRFRVFLPSGAPPAGWDAIRVDGVEYELAGDANAVWHPFERATHHVEAEVVRVR